MLRALEPVSMRMTRAQFGILLGCLSLAAACSTRVAAQPNPARNSAEIRGGGALRQREVPTEFRGAWIATVDNIDFPSRQGLPVAGLRRELDAIVARAVDLGLNALIFQVRPAADAFYRSPLEPWSEWLTGAQGAAPLAQAAAGELRRAGGELHGQVDRALARVAPSARPPSWKHQVPTARAALR